MKPTFSFRVVAALMPRVVVVTALLAGQQGLRAQGTAFTYQGRLDTNGVPFTGNAEFQATLWDAPSGGTKVADNQPAVILLGVTNGLFLLPLDFGTNFPGAERWLQLEVRTTFGPFTALSPRQRLSPTPYAITAGNLSGVIANSSLPANPTFSGTVTAGNFSGSGAGLTTLNASQLTAGTVPDARLSANVALLNSSPTFSGSVTSLGDLAGVRLKIGNSPVLEGAYASIAGGQFNTNQGPESVIAGGLRNWIETTVDRASIGGGASNAVLWQADYATIAGGLNNVVNGYARASVIGGGSSNVVYPYASYATIPGGQNNSATNYAFAAGRRARANHVGTFVWADSIDADFASTAANQFLIRASGGLAINTNDPGGAALRVAGIARADTVRAATVRAGVYEPDGGPLVLGTSDNQPVEFRVNGLRALRLEDNGDSNDTNTLPDGAPNVIGGAAVNFVAPGVVGAVIAGGGATNFGGFARSNAVWANFGTIGGGLSNRIGAGALGATIGGGSAHAIGTNGVYSMIGGGWLNTIGGGVNAGVIAGGQFNDIASGASWSAILGGYDNYVGSGSQHVLVSGGYGNWIGTNCSYGFIGGGFQNSIVGSCMYATVAGGQWNSIGVGANHSTIGGGLFNTIPANAQYATIPGGGYNFATNYAFAAGYMAKAYHEGSFVWADRNGELASSQPDSVTMRAAGGYRLFSDASASTGVFLASGGGAWGTLSDRNAKDDFQPVNPLEVLEKVVALPVMTWRYKSQDAAVRHIGPVAQDFHAAFGVGESERTITTVDADGVALAAIQGLNQKLEIRNQESEVRIQKLEEANALLRQRVAVLEELLGQLLKGNGGLHEKSQNQKSRSDKPRSGRSEF